MSKRLPGIQDGERNAEEIDVARFVKLMEAGYDDFAVSTEHGSFQWTPPPRRPNSRTCFEFCARCKHRCRHPIDRGAGAGA